MGIKLAGAARSDIQRKSSIKDAKIIKDGTQDTEPMLLTEKEDQSELSMTNTETLSKQFTYLPKVVVYDQ